MGRVWSAVWLIAALALAGCASSAVQEVTEWSLEHEEHRVPLVLPAHFQHELPPRRSAYSLRATATIPDAWRGRTVSLSAPALPAGTSLTVDGTAIDPVDARIEPGHRHAAYVWRIPEALTAQGALELELRVPHLWTASAWIDVVPRLGVDPSGDLHTRFVRGFNLWTCAIGLGTLGTIAFTYFVLFLFDRRSDTYRYLALQTGTAIYYFLFQLGFSQPITGHLDGPLLAVCLPAAAVFGVRASQARFALPPISRLWWAALAISIATVAVAVAYGPFIRVLPTSWPVVATLAAAIVFQVVTLARVARRRRDPDAALDLVFWTGIGLSAPIDGLFYAGAGEWLGGVRLAGLGLCVFAPLQFITLSRAVLRHQREIEALNAELRRQIAERSRQLEDALSRLGDESAIEVKLMVGDVVEERYRVVRVLGSGAAGVVYEVVRLADGRQLAMKVLRESNLHKVARFAREAHVIGELDHPNVVSIVDFGIASSGFVFLVLEYIEGRGLDAWRDRFGDVAWALPVLADVASGLAAIHARGIIHRDLKPSNILLADGTVPKISDFGIAGLRQPGGEAAPSATDETPSAVEGADAPAPARPAPCEDRPPGLAPDPLTESPPTRALPAGKRRRPPDGAGRASALRLTQTRAFMGTPRYMAPELAHGTAATSEAADVFGFGVLAYEMLTGGVAFAEPPSLALRRGHTPPRTQPSWSADSGVPPAIGQLIDRCLDFDPTSRPTASELSAALAAHAGRPDA